MKEINAIMEINLLLNNRLELNKINKELHYLDEKRIEELRKFIDSLNDDKVVKNDSIENNEVTF